MKKLTSIAACLAIFGFSNVAIAGVDFPCNTYDDAYCAGGVTWEVELNCWDTPALNDAYQGGLNVSTVDGDWDLAVQYDDDTTAGDGFEDICDANGEVNTPKTEMKCTHAMKGSNKPGQDQDDDNNPQVDFEIKLVGDACGG